jgi:DNA-binding response OmpR family regulator
MMMDSPKRILYADDDKDSAIMMATLLEAMGYEVETAPTAAAALRQAESARFDLYVIDNHFPDGTGVEMCRQVRQWDGRTPLVIYSGTSTEADFDEALKAGAQAYVVKPYLDELLARINGLLKS